ncbi:MAG: bifunctional phosphoribosylaminoimidazolecarboxamide formyltransferase/IMP cyclohydrolase [Sarcina sp.]
MIKRALLSVYDKKGILELANFLRGMDVELISSGGTYKYLKENGVEVTEISKITKSDEMLDGRVKTLHPIIHGGILAIRDNKEHMETLKEKAIDTIDMVVVNLYPFFEKVKEDITFEEKVEFIDIGGPTMLRAAAKNFRDVTVISDIEDYETVIDEMKNGEVTYNTKRRLAGKVFNLMSSYDGAIANFLLEENDSYEKYLSLAYKKERNLRYGENPHQQAAYYVSADGKGAMADFEILNGKELSYNNIKDMDIAWKVVNEFEEIACCGLKHNTPCGVAIGSTVKESYLDAFSCDETSIFGGIVAINRKIDKATAEEMVKIFLEVVAAPEFDEEALEVLRTKKNLRVLKMNQKPINDKFMVSVDGGILVQEEDNQFISKLDVVTKKQPTEEELENLKFAMKVVKYVKSNAIVVAKGKKAVGIGGGQVNRIWPTVEALKRGEGATVLASDAFFPFDDCVREAGKYDIKAIIQPGGSLNDKLSIEACDELGIAMVCTGIRHFKH